MEKASKILDMKAMAKPQSFDGTESTWLEWKFRMQNPFHSSWSASEAETMGQLDEKLFIESLKERSRFLYAVLTQVCGGRALNLVRRAPRGWGFSAWQNLVKEYEPKLALRWTSMLSELLTPKWKEDNFQDQLYEWERLVSNYEAASQSQVPAEVKCAVIVRWSPKALRDYFRLIPIEATTNYEELRKQIELFFQRYRTFDPLGQIQLDSTAMDIGQLVAWIKGKGKGKEKGSGKDKGKKGKGEKGKKGGKSEGWLPQYQNFRQQPSTWQQQQQHKGKGGGFWSQ